MLKVTLGFDPDTDSPADDDGSWRLISFNTRHKNYENISFTLYTDEFKEKLKEGFAFILSYYEHSGSLWSIQGSGPQCPWDTVQTAGILIWEHDPDEMGAKTPEDRRKDAESFLESYNDWCNGQCFWYNIEKEDGEYVDSCGGFIGSKYFLEQVNEVLKQYPDEEYEFVGEAKDLAEYR